MKLNKIKDMFKILSGFILLKIKDKFKITGVVFLTYHRVGNDSDYLHMAVSKEEFQKQMEFVSHYFNLISFDQAVGVLEKKNPDSLYFAITFDDGFKDNSLAFDYLKDIRVRPALFISVDAVDRNEIFWFEKMRISSRDRKSCFDFFNKRDLLDIYKYLKTIPQKQRHEIIDDFLMDQDVQDCEKLPEELFEWVDLKEYAERKEIIVGSHGMCHESLKFLNRDQIKYELKRSKEVIEQKLGVRVDTYAYPNGGKEDVPDDIDQIFKESGYKNAFTLGGGVNHRLSYKIRRICMTSGVYKSQGGHYNKYIFSFNIFRNVLPEMFPVVTAFHRFIKKFWRN